MTVVELILWRVGGVKVAYRGVFSPGVSSRDTSPLPLALLPAAAHAQRVAAFGNHPEHGIFWVLEIYTG